MFSALIRTARRMVGAGGKLIRYSASLDGAVHLRDIESKEVLASLMLLHENYRWRNLEDLKGDLHRAKVAADRLWVLPPVHSHCEKDVLGRLENTVVVLNGIWVYPNLVGSEPHGNSIAERLESLHRGLGAPIEILTESDVTLLSECLGR